MKRWIGTAVVAWMVFVVLAAGQESIFNPYAGVDWASFEPHRANLHTHTLRNRVLQDGSIVYVTGDVRTPDGQLLHPGESEFNHPRRVETRPPRSGRCGSMNRPASSRSTPRAGPP